MLPAMGHEQPQICAWEYDMTGQAEQCVERYLELSKQKESDLKQVATPCMDDHLFAPEDFTERGELDSVASKCVLKALHLARLGRPDDLWAANSLARELTAHRSSGLLILAR